MNSNSVGNCIKYIVAVNKLTDPTTRNIAALTGLSIRGVRKISDYKFKVDCEIEHNEKLFEVSGSAVTLYHKLNSKDFSFEIDKRTYRKAYKELVKAGLIQEQ